MTPPGAPSKLGDPALRQGCGAGELGCVLGDPAGSWTHSCACPVSQTSGSAL